jgi:hypothetical protein
MNRNLKISLASLFLATASGHSMAEEIVVYGTPMSARIAPVERAFGACANEVIARIMPGQKVKVRSALNVSDREAYKALAYHDMIFTLVAKSKRDGSRLADASCTSTQSGRVVNLSVRIDKQAKLAGLVPQDLKFAMAGR